MKISSTKTNPKRTTILKDFVLILAITVFLFFLEYVFEAFEKLADFFLREKPKAVTELVAGLTIFTIVFAVFSISKWKRLRGALTKCERAEEKYHTIFEESKDAIYITTREGKIIDMNQSVLALFGYTKNEMIGMDVRKFYVNPVDRQKFQQEIEKNEFVREYEVKLCKKDGTEMDCLLTSTVWRSEDGSVAGYQGIIRDITERRQMAKMVRSMLDNVVMGISMISPKMEILWLNKTLKDWFPNVDVEKKPLCYQSFYLPPKKEICDYCPTIKAFETGRIHSAEMGICADGRIYNVIATPVKDEKGETIYVVETVEDITERKVSEEEVKRTGTYLESILNNSLDLIFTIKKDGTFGYINPQLEKVTGYKEKQIRGKYFIDFIPEQRKEFMLGKWKEINEGIAGKYETEIIRADGTLMDCLVSHSVLEGYDEFLVTLKDITERKRAEETLQESEERFRALSEAAFEGVVIHEQGKILELNQTLAKMFGYEREELIGRSGLDLVIPETRKAILEHMRSGSEKPYEGIGIKNDGTTFPIEICGRTTLYKGRVVRVGAIRDITERKRMEEELQRSYEKLQRTTMGTISAMAKVVEIRDPYTAGHHQRVANLASAIAKEMSLSEKQVNGIYMAASIHDIGKIYIPTEVLTKPSRLTEIEFSVVKIHPQHAYNILEKIEFSTPVAQVVLQHHERIDGSGYPIGLAGTNLLLEALILAVADVIEAMVFPRPYRPSLGIGKALEEISHNKGILYHPEVVDACLRLFNKKGFKFE